MGQRKRVVRPTNGPSSPMLALARSQTSTTSAPASVTAANGAAGEHGLYPTACQFIISPFFSVTTPLASDGGTGSEGTVRVSPGNGVSEANDSETSDALREEECQEPSAVGVKGNGAGTCDEVQKIANESSSMVSNAAEKGVAGSAASCGSKDGCTRGLRAECEKALLALRRGNSTKSLRLIRDACVHNEESSLVHRVHGHICMRLASMIEDARTKQRHFKEALEAAKRAVVLSPSSVEYAHFHAQLLYDGANDSKEYEEVVRECERGLSIEDPVDPAKESLQEEGQHELATPKARILHYQQELRGLVQKANIASISTWMKSLGNGGDDKLRFIQMRKIGDDPLEHCILQPKRPNEVKKSVKTPEERRKEIEVRVAAARLLQQRTEAGTPAVSVDSLTESEKLGQRRSERRKSGASSARKPSRPGDSEEKMEQVKSFWHASNPHVRETLLQVPLTGLRAHLISSRTSSSSLDSLNEALAFAEDKKTWRFWACCRCGEKFTESQEHINHVMQEHIGSLPFKLQSILPRPLEKEWAEQLAEEDCAPIDGRAAIKLLVDSSIVTLLEDSTHESLCTAANNGGFDCFSEASEGSLSPRDSSTEHFVDASCTSGETFEGKTNLPGSTVCLLHLRYETEELAFRPSFHLCRGECQGEKSMYWRPSEVPLQDFPLADDEERKNLLERIYGLFKTLIRSKCLAMEHVIKIIHYAIEEIQNMVPDPTVHYHFHHSPVYVRFLPQEALKSVHKYLCELVHASGVDRHLNEAAVSDNGPSSENPDSDIIQDRLYLDEEFTLLNLDERIVKEFPDLSSQDCKLRSANKCGKNQNLHEELGPASEALPLMRPKDSKQKPVFADLQLSWIYGSAEYEQQSDAWKQLQEDRAYQGREVLRALEKEFLQLQHVCERKREAISYEEVLNNAENLCLRETRKRESFADGICRSYETVLKRRHQELLARRTIGLPFHEKLELDAISNILKDAQSVQVSRFSHETSLSAASPRISDSDEDDEDPWHIHDSIQRSDSCIELTIQQQKDSLSTEVSQLDAKIMKSMDSLQRSEHKLALCSIFDYRSVMLPLLKSFLKARLEVAAEKDALEKSDAAREAFLEELDKDKKNVGNRGTESGKHAREKVKEKKKSKESRKGKDAKVRAAATGYNGSQLVDANGTSEEELEDGPDQETLNWYENKEKQWQEAELRRQEELEAEERKLNEALELQRKVEEEAKKKHLAQQKKKLANDESSERGEIGDHALFLQNDSQGSSSHKIAQGDTGLSPVLDAQLVVPDLSMTKCEPEELTIATATSLPLVDGAQQLSEKAFGISCGSNSRDIAGLTPLHSLDIIEYVNENPSPKREKSGFPENVKDKGSWISTAISPGSSPSKDIVYDAPKPNMIGFQSWPEPVVLKAAAQSDGDKKPCQSSRRSNSKSRRRRALRVHSEGSIANNGNGSAVADVSLESSSPFKMSSLSCSNEDSTKVSSSVVNVLQAPLLLLEAPSSDHRKHSIKCQVEPDDEEQFQADLEQAMRQSLDVLYVQSLPDAMVHVNSIKAILPEAVYRDTSNQNAAASIQGYKQRGETDEVGIGLQNEVGQYNCFLNVVIQSLWHLKRFREELLAGSSAEHMHIGDPCVVCALRDIFIGLNSELLSPNSEAITPTGLRVALSAMYAESDFFQEAQMNDASEVLAVIYDCLHKAFTPNAGSDEDSEESTAGGSWDCQDSHPCIAHSLFGLDIAEQMNCKGCGLESRHLKYTSFFHNINASALRTAKTMFPDSSLDELLKYVDMNHQLACDVESGGCGRQNYIHHLLRVSPHVFTTVLGWQNGQENSEDISATIDAIDLDVDVGVVYRGLDEGHKHQLVSVVCYYGQHYHCFAYNHEIRTWVMFDDTTVKVVGEWDEVVRTCRKGHLQPQVLFYEAVCMC